MTAQPIGRQNVVEVYYSFLFTPKIIFLGPFEVRDSECQLLGTPTVYSVNSDSTGSLALDLRIAQIR